MRALRCPACGWLLRQVFVHGHGQCVHCGTNIEDCCTGSGDEADEAAGREILHVDTEQLRKLLARLGAAKASLTEECLVQGLCTALGWTWDEALRALRVAVERGILRGRGAGVYRLAKG